MRFEDIIDLFKLRRFTANPMEILRFRKKRNLPGLLRVELLDGPPLSIRGACQDFHIFHRVYLRDEYRLKGHAPKSWSCVVDLGANVGLFAARASTVAERVFAFEPFQENFEALAENVSGREGVEAVNEAVAGAAGTLRLYAPKDPERTGAFSSFREDDGAMAEDFDEVRATTLNEIFERFGIERCELVKIDIEGQEYEVLHGTSDATFARIDRIHGEYHDVRPDDPRTRIEEFITFLDRKGYEVEIVPHRKKDNHGMFYAVRPGLS